MDLDLLVVNEALQRKLKSKKKSCDDSTARVRSKFMQSVDRHADAARSMLSDNDMYACYLDFVVERVLTPELLSAFARAQKLKKH